MGMSTNAMLVYGYHLGGGELGWALEDLGEYDELPTLDWYDPDTEGEDFQEAAETKLLASVGFTETDWQADGYHDRRGEARKTLGVELETHCSADYPGYLLIAKGITARQGDAKPIDFACLAHELAAADADAKLRAALDALGLKSTQERAQWLLCSYWG